MRVGIKALKNKLSLYLRRVRGGETVTVTVRGVAIAVLRAVESRGTSVDKGLAGLAAEGVIALGTGKFETFKPVRARAAVSSAILDDRG